MSLEIKTNIRLNKPYMLYGNKTYKEKLKRHSKYKYQ